MDCNDLQFKRGYKIEYPFEFAANICYRRLDATKTDNTSFYLSVDSSTGAQFFALTAVLALLYSLFIIFVYCYLDEMYKSKPEFPMADFGLTAGLAFFWLVATLALNSGGSAMKKIFDENYIAQHCHGCQPNVSSFTDLNIALMIGFLNFFLWASDLWFLYKETIWFQNRGAIMNQQMYPGQQQQQFGDQQYGQQQQQQQYGQPSQYEQQQQFTQQYNQEYGQMDYGQSSYGQAPM
jgi:hypothetical protein